jgi:hypothetical protein
VHLNRVGEREVQGKVELTPRPLDDLLKFLKGRPWFVILGRTLLCERREGGKNH